MLHACAFEIYFFRYCFCWVGGRQKISLLIVHSSPYIFIYTAVTQLKSKLNSWDIFTLLSCEYLLLLISRFCIATIYRFYDLEIKAIQSVCTINCHKSQSLCCVHILLYLYSTFRFFFHYNKN